MYILFDVGGTKIRVAGTSNLKDFKKVKKVKNPGMFKEGIDILLSLIKEVANGEKIEGIAGGIAGSYDKKEGKLLASPNMKDWVNEPFKKILQKEFNTPLHIDNDAAMAVIGESKRGAGKGYEIVGYITVSTGVGGSRAVNGLVDKRAITYEPGHQIIKISNKIETLENLVSGGALKEKFGKEPYEIKNKKIWEELAEYLGIGLYNTILHWSPDVMVLGGPMIVKNPSIPFKKIKKKVENLLGVFSYCPEIKKSELGDEAVLYGSLEYLKILKD